MSASLIKTEKEIKKMQLAGRLAAEVLEMLGEHVVPGISTGELDRICHRYIVEEQNAYPAPLDYRGFPRSICTSVNHVVCHGIPSDKHILKDGDLANIDVTVIKDGFHGDTSKMFAVGACDEAALALSRVTQECLYRAISIIRDGIQLGDIGHVVARHAEANGYSVVREYCGHGIGRGFHEDPQIVHYGEPGTGRRVRAGMTFTVEPMLNAGTRHVQLDRRDGWTVRTRDRQLSAQWEHTLLVRREDCKVLTARAEETFDHVAPDPA